MGNKQSNMEDDIWSKKQLLVLTYMDDDLITLLLDGEKLRAIPSAVFELAKLQKVDLKDNKIKRVPKKIKKMKELVELYLDNNDIEGLPGEISRCWYLEVISASKNRIEELPDEIGELDDLRLLLLKNNFLTTLPPSIGDLRILEVLAVSRNKITRLPKEIGDMSSLVHLKLGHNHLKEIPSSIGHLRRLQIISVKNNSLSSVPPEIGELFDLREMNLSNNHIVLLPPTMGRLVRLEKLFVQSNRLHELPPALSNCKHLMMLEVKHNPISNVPPDVTNYGCKAILDYLKELGYNVDVRKIQCMVLGHTGSGKTSLVQSILGQKAQAGVTFDRTHLVEQLCWRPSEEDDLEIQINDFGPASFGVIRKMWLSNRIVPLLVFDISTTDMTNYDSRIKSWIKFIDSMAPNAQVFMVATNKDKCSAEEIKEKLDTLLRRMKSDEKKMLQGLDADISSIRACMEGKDNTEANENINKYMIIDDESMLQSLLDSFTEKRKTRVAIPRGVEDIHIISSASYDGIPQLMTCLQDACRDQEVYPAFNVPPSWTDVAAEIHRLETQPGGVSLATSDVKQVFMNNNIVHSDKDNKTVLEVLQFLVESGEILWYDTPLLQALIYPSPKKVVDLLRSVITYCCSIALDVDKAENNQATLPVRGECDILKGALSIDTIKTLWLDFSDNSESFTHLLETLLRLELCYQTPLSDDVFSIKEDAVLTFPLVLQAQKSEKFSDTWPVEIPQGLHQLSVVYDFQHSYPAGVFEQLIVRVNRLPLVKSRTDWCWGTLLEHNSDCRVLLEAGPHHSHFYLRVRAANIKLAWYMVGLVHRETLALLTQLPNMFYQVWIQCPLCLARGEDHPCKFPGQWLTHPPKTKRFACQLKPSEKIKARNLCPSDKVLFASDECDPSLLADLFSLENKLYFRLDKLCKTCGLQVVRGLFEELLAKSGPLLFYEWLEEHSSRIWQKAYACKLNRYLEQLYLLSQPGQPLQAIAEVTPEDLDIATMAFLIQGTSLLPPPCGGSWNYADIQPSDCSQTADVVRLKQLRRFLSQKSALDVDEKAFGKLWQEMEGAVSRLGGSSSSVAQIKSWDPFA